MANSQKGNYRATKRPRKVKTNNPDSRALLTWHRLHEGVYARVARTLGVDASYVSRVASGHRRSETIEHALISELQRIQRLRP